MDNEFKFDEYEFSGEEQAVEPEAIEALEQAPVAEAPIEEAPVAAPAEKKKSNFKFSPKMLIAPGVIAVILIINGISGGLINTVTSLVYTSLGYEFIWVINLVSGILGAVISVIGLVIAAGVGYFCYKNISKALKFMGVVYGSWAIGQAVSSVAGFVFSIISQICINNYNYQAYSIVNTISGIVTGIIAFVISVVAAALLNILLEKAEAKKAEEKKAEEKKAAEEAKQEAEEIVEEVIEEVSEEAAEKEEKPKKKALPINKKVSILMAVAVVITSLLALPDTLMVLLGISGQWTTVLYGLLNMFVSIGSVAACAVLGFVATKKVDGAIKFLGAYKVSACVVGVFSSVIFAVINAIISAFGLTSIFYVIGDVVVGIPVLIITAALAVALINLFDMGVNFKKKSKKSKIEEAAAEVKEEIEEEIEDVIEDIEEVVEISAE